MITFVAMNNMMRTLTTILFAIALALAGCRQAKWADGTPVPNSFFGIMSFGDSQQKVLKGFYGLGFTDAATREQDSHFDTVPSSEAGTTSVLFKIMVPPDTAGFSYLGQRWANVQVQLDGHGLYSVTFHSPCVSQTETAKLYVELIKTLESRHYRMMRTVVGTSAQDGETHDIVGHRYTCGNAMLQTHLNNAADGAQSISLTFTQTKPE